MKNILPLDERINKLVKKKLTICECNPCTCPNQKKDEYFQELNAILTSYNIEIFAYYLYKDHFQNKMNL
ncbi:MAG: hypothetical protein KBF59_04660 [Ignavibacterium sp.]|jgi:hypothetical protein|nr:hypothetical protein [Ignavibacterium sp.]